MADFINNVAAQDAYVDALSLGPDFATRKVVITVANNPALMQFAVGRMGAWRWTDEREYFSIPQSFSVGNIIGVRFRNAVAGQAARILATLTTPEDPDFQAGTPFTSTLNAQGGISSAVIVPVIALAAFPPANPQDGQLVSLELPATFDPIGGKAIRWLCEYDSSLAMWHVHDGAPLYDEVATSEATTSLAYVDLATIVGITIPRPGDYSVEGDCDALTSIADDASMSVGVNSFGAPIEAVSGMNGSNVNREHLHVAGFLTALAANASIRQRYKTDAANSITFRNRVLKATPVRIS